MSYRFKSTSVVAISIVAYVIGNDSNMIVLKTEFEKFESSYQQYELHAIYSSDKHPIYAKFMPNFFTN
jgi:hypothetical protein